MGNMSGYVKNMDVKSKRSNNSGGISPPISSQIPAFHVIQPKLTIGAPNDVYEKEADRLTDRVMRMPSPANLLSFPVQRSQLYIARAKQALSSFERQTYLYESLTGDTNLGLLDKGRRIVILIIGSTRHFVEVTSGPLSNSRGYINTDDVVIPGLEPFPNAPWDNTKLVFFQNTERIGSTIEEVGVGITRRSVAITNYRTGEVIQYIQANERVYLESIQPDEDNYRVNYSHGSNNVFGYVPRDAIGSDASNRRKDRNYYRDFAQEIANSVNSIFVDPRTQACIDQPYPIEYLTGTDIANSVIGAAKCRTYVNEIHIVAHGGTHGIGGTGDYSHYYGLYINKLIGRLSQERSEGRSGGMTIDEFYNSIYSSLDSQGVDIWIYACRTGEDRDGEPGFSESLAIKLNKDLPIPRHRVHGMTGTGYVESTNRWVHYPGE